MEAHYSQVGSLEATVASLHTQLAAKASALDAVHATSRRQVGLLTLELEASAGLLDTAKDQNLSLQASNAALRKELAERQAQTDTLHAGESGGGGGGCSRSCF